jgi:hypothetical protein
MNKVLLVILVLGAAGLAYYLIGGNTGDLSFEADTVEEVDLDLVEEALKETGKRTVYGSCNVIATGSNCIDYIGSMWNDNDLGKLSCVDVGTFSKNACPYSVFGGCQTNAGTVMEIIDWVYEEGPGDYNEESVPYAMMACNSMPNSVWITPEALLKQ